MEFEETDIEGWKYGDSSNILTTHELDLPYWEADHMLIQPTGLGEVN